MTEKINANTIIIVFLILIWTWAFGWGLLRLVFCYMLPIFLLGWVICWILYKVTEALGIDENK